MDELILYSNDGLGSYSPRKMNIELKKKFDEFCRPYRNDTLSDEELSIFIHEFVHHIQKTASVIGLLHFDATIGLWHSIRNYIDDAPEKKDLSSIDRTIEILSYWKSNNQDKYRSLDHIEIIEIHDVALNDNLECIKQAPFRITCSHGDIFFGLHEYLECAAFIIERTFCKVAKIPFNESKAIPYKIIDAIITHHNLNFTDNDLISIILTSLQHTTPHYQFYGIIKQLDASQYRNIGEVEKKDNLEAIFLNHCKDLLEVNQSFILDITKGITNGLPINNIHDNAIKRVLANINSNLEKRLDAPFFELDILQSINHENIRAKLYEIVNYFGGCPILKKDPDKQDGELGESVIREYGENGCLVTYQNNDLEVFRAMQHYTESHITICNGERKILSPEDNNNQISNCPAYSYCQHKKRSENRQICQNMPWMHPQGEVESFCNYQIAVYKTLLKNAYNR